MFKITVGTRSSRQAFLSMPTFISFISQQRKVGKLLLVSDRTNPPYNTQHISSLFLFVNFPYERFIMQANRPACVPA